MGVVPAYSTGKRLRAIHVTDDPTVVQTAIREGRDLADAARPGVYQDIGPGLYASAAPGH